MEIKELISYANGLKQFNSTRDSLKDDLLDLGADERQVIEIVEGLHEHGMIDLSKGDRFSPIDVVIPTPAKPKPAPKQASPNTGTTYTDEDARNDGMSTEPTGFEPDEHDDMHPIARKLMLEQLADTRIAESLGGLGISKEFASRRRKQIVAEANKYSEELKRLNDGRWDHVYRYHPHELKPVEGYGKVSSTDECVERAVKFCEERGRPTDAESIAWFTGIAIEEVRSALA